MAHVYYAPLPNKPCDKAALSLTLYVQRGISCKLFVMITTGTCESPPVSLMA